MKNVPGTVLFVSKQRYSRAFNHVYPHFVSGQKSATGVVTAKQFHIVTKIPYGEICMMLSIEDYINSSKIKALNVLWRDKFITLYMTNNQMNKSFCLYKQWINRGHPERLENFKKQNNGLRILYKACGLQDLYDREFA